MPIKASFFDAWLSACKDDYFCGSGSYWGCARDTTCAPTEVANSNYAVPGSINGTLGTTISVSCNPGFSGGGAAGDESRDETGEGGLGEGQ